MRAGAAGSAYRQASRKTCPGTTGAVRWPPKRRISSESGKALKSPVTIVGKGVSPPFSAMNSARAVTWPQRTAEPSGADVRWVVKNGMSYEGWRGG